MVTLLVIDSGFILITALILFILLFILAYKTQTNWLFAIAGLLWIIPMTLIDNMIVIVVSVAMLIFCGVFAWTRE